MTNKCPECKKVKALEEHHTSYSPLVKVWLCRKCHQTIHNIISNSSERFKVARMYDFLTKLNKQLTIWATAFSKNFEKCNIQEITSLKKEIVVRKKSLAIELYLSLTAIEKTLLDDVKGLGKIYLAKLFAYAHPDKFSSCRRFLAYCGYTERTFGKGRKLKDRKKTASFKYSRKAKNTAWFIGDTVIRCKDKHFYAKYLEIKQTLKKKQLSISKSAAHRIAKNRMTTLLLKFIYRTYNQRKNLKPDLANNQELNETSTVSIPLKVIA